MPLLVDENDRLIDGLRRLRAAHDLGITEVPVVVSDEYSTSIAVIQAAREHGLLSLPADHRRLMEAYTDLLKQLKDRVHRQHVARSGLKPGQRYPKGVRVHPARFLFSEVFDVSQSAAQSAIFIARLLLNPEGPHYEVGLKVLGMLDRGEVSLSTSGQMFHKLSAASNPRFIKDVQTQRTILNNALTNMTAAVTAMRQVAELSGDLSTEELTILKVGFAKVRGFLQGYNSVFKRRTENQ